MDQDKKYNRTYYERNRERILEQRRKKYQDDDSYREAVKRSAAKHHVKKDGVDRRGRKPGPLPPVNVKFQGKVMKAYPSALVAMKLGIKIATLRKWVHNGVIPNPPIERDSGWLWPESAVDVLVRAEKECGEDLNGKGRKDAFSEYVKQFWPVKRGEESK